MKIITFECKAVSHLFIGNAKTKNAELRMPAIKSSLRFWWRALHSHLNTITVEDDKTYNKLKKMECELFGGSYKVTIDDKEEIIENLSSFSFLEYKDQISKKSFKIDPRADKTRSSNAFKENTGFDISIRLRPNASLKNILSIFQIASALGGIGKRARRGSGAWKINEIFYEGFNESDVEEKSNSLNYDLNSIFNSINNLVVGKYEVLNNKIEIVGNRANSFPYLKSIQIGSDYNTQEELRTRIMKTAHCLKNKNQYGKYLGKTFDGRIASPVYVSILKSNNSKVKPIISTLDCGNIVEGLNLQQEFRNFILNNQECNNNN